MSGVGSTDIKRNGRAHFSRAIFDLEPKCGVG